MPVLDTPGDPVNSLYYTLSSIRSQFLEFVNIDWIHLEPFLAII